MPAERAPHSVNVTRRSIAPAALAAALVLGACANEGSTRRSAPQSETARRMAANQLTAESLQELNFAFADRYTTLIAAACDSIIENNPDPAERAAAARVKISYVTSIYDVVTSNDPISQVVDLTLVITLQSQVFIDDARAEDMFGERAEPLVTAIRRSREDIWALAGRLFSVEEQDLFDRLIWSWRRKNQHIDFVGLVRFDEFATERARNILNEAKSSGGLFAPVDDARRAVEEARILGERVFFMAKRMPTIIEWQVMAAGDALISHPEINRTIESHLTIAPALNNVAGSIDGLGDELDTQRAALLAGVDERLARAGELTEAAIARVQSLADHVEPALGAAAPLVADLRAAADSLNASAVTAERIVQRLTVPPDDPRFQPFNINEYAAAAQNLADAARELQSTLDRTDDLLAADTLNTTIEAHRLALVADASALIDRLFWRLVALLVLAFALFAGYRWITRRPRAAAP